MATNKLIQSIFLLSLVNSVPVEAQKVIYEDDNPKVKVALPDNGADGRAVVICPGGGYNHAGKPKEADDWIPFFTRQGIAVATLMYDLPNGDKDVPLGQLRRVFALLRRHASDWHIDAGEIGIMGSSAGGHLATTFATHEPVADRPAFQILFILLSPSCRNLTGEWRNVFLERQTKNNVRLIAMNSRSTR